MKNLKKVLFIISIVVLAVIIALPMVACKKKYKSDYEYVKEAGNGNIVVGYTNYPPMNYNDKKTGVLVGFDTELAKLAFAKIGLEPKFQLIDWNNKHVELDGKTIDCIWNGMTIDADRESKVSFTRPYLKNKQVVVAKLSKQSLYPNKAAIKAAANVSIAVEGSSAGETFAMEIMGVKKVEDAKNIIIPKSTQMDAVTEVKSGTTDLAIVDFTLAEQYVATNKDCVLLPIIEEENYGVAFRKGSDITSKIDNAIDELIKDGTYNQLLEKYMLVSLANPSRSK